MKHRSQRSGWVLMALVLVLSLVGCSSTLGNSLARGTPSPTLLVPSPVATPKATEGANATHGLNKPPMPAKLKDFEGEVPMIRVYVVADKNVETMSLEQYLYGVLAGEMKNDWPMEALKAQAILARTFVLRFMSEKESKYEGADISTDIEEAQAYDAKGVNDRIRQAVDETRGLALSAEGEFPYAWFHAHSGGSTALAREGLGYEKPEPMYTKVTAGKESHLAPEDAKSWEHAFSASQILKAAAEQGVSGSALESIQIGEKGKSGRALTLIINGKIVQAPQLRIALGSTQMRSTLLDKVSLANGSVTMSGKGYGHGVGMSQWGAYGMADGGSSAEQIVTYYFQGVSVVKMW